MPDQTFDRLQMLVSQLELFGEMIYQEDVNQKLLRSLSPEWKTHVVVWMNKADMNAISMDDLYNNLKVYEPEFKGMSSSNSNTQNMAFLSSTNSSTNAAVNTANRVSTASTQVNSAFSTNIDSLSDAVICAFLASQPNSPQLVHEDLKQIHPNNKKEMDLRWQMAMLTMKAKRDTLLGSGRAPRNQDFKHKESTKRTVPVETPAFTTLVSCDGLGRYDWSDQAEEGSNYELMAYTSLNSDSKMIGNMSYLIDFEEIDRGYVAFGGNPKGRNITGKGTKDETSGILKSFITRIENLIDHKVKVIRCDNETEIKNKEMNQFCEMKGILRQYSVARTSQQHEVAKRRNMTLIEAARTMLADSKLPTTFWAEAVNTACYVQNRVLLVKPHNKTPYEIFHGRTPTLSFMRPFGYPVTILNTKDPLGKSNGKVDECFFVGYSLISIAFRVFNSRTMIVEENLHIRFSESTPNVVGSGSDWLFDIDALTKTRNYETIIVDPRQESVCKDQEKQVNVNGTNTVNAASTNKVNVVGEIISIELPFDLNMHVLKDIGTFDFSNKDEDDYAVADMNNLDTTIQVSPTLTIRIHKDPPLDQVIGDLHSATQTRNISKNLEEHGNEKDERGIMIRNKSRLVAQGHTQEEWIDYDEVFAPVARIEAIRLFLSYASFKDFMVYQMDVKSAFLYEKIEEDVRELWNASEKLMHEKIHMSSMGELKFFLRLQVKQKNDGIFISQDKYVTKILKKFGFIEVKNARTSLETQKTLLKDEDGKEVDVHMYRYQVNPKVSHLHAVKGIFRYLKGQLKLGLWYPKDSPFDLVAYTDSDYVGASLDRKSIIGEAEYVVASSCCGQVLWIQNQLLDYGVDGKEIINTESSVKRDLRLADEDGVDCFLNSTILERGDRLVRVAITASSLEAEQDSGNIDKTQSKATPNEASSSRTTSGGGLRCQEAMKDTIAQTMFENVSKLSNDSPLVRARVDSSEDEQELGEDASKQGRIEAIDVDEDITLVNDQDDAEMFDVNDLRGEEVFVDKDDVVKEVNAAGELNDASIATTDSAVATITTEEVTLAKALTELKASKPKDKGKGIMVEEHVKLKKKDQIRLDEEVTLKLQVELQAEFEEEQRLAREKAQKELEASIALIETWDDVHAKIDADYQMIERLQAEEQQELTDEEKATLFMKFLKKRRKFFAAKREKREGEELTQKRSKKQKVDDNKETTELKKLMEIIPNKEEVAIDAIPLAVNSP
nr:retrovirus-related Pol polyprotein from transposon TNT 1-94 [Tanacetum cinerariifolium]